MKKTYDHILQQNFAYESRPYVAVMIGIAGVVHAQRHESLLSLLSGIVLIACGVLVLHWRFESRRR